MLRKQLSRKFENLSSPPKFSFNFDEDVVEEEPSTLDFDKAYVVTSNHNVSKKYLGNLERKFLQAQLKSPP